VAVPTEGPAVACSPDAAPLPCAAVTVAGGAAGAAAGPVAVARSIVLARVARPVQRLSRSRIFWTVASAAWTRR
jgi:hypothetical protein